MVKNIFSRQDAKTAKVFLGELGVLARDQEGFHALSFRDSTSPGDYQKKGAFA